MRIFLHDVTNRYQFDKYYEQEGLKSNEEKCKHLVEKIYSLGNVTDGDIKDFLRSLEMHVMEGFWKYIRKPGVCPCCGRDLNEIMMEAGVGCGGPCYI